MNDTARKFAERMLTELETDMGVHHDEPFLRMSRLRLSEFRNALRGLLDQPEDGGITQALVSMARENALAECAATHAPEVRAGWKLVPVEPTTAMLHAFFAAAAEGSAAVIEPRIYTAYKAMLEASPIPQETHTHAPEKKRSMEIKFCPACDKEWTQPQNGRT